jgi:pyruvate dehydrogenase E1 component beta subunit
MLGVALKAAGSLEREGVGVEIVDLRTLTPVDENTVLESVRKTGRLVVLHEATRTGGFGGEIAALAAEKAFDALKAPVKRVAAPDIPVPFSKPLEDFYLPNENDLIQAVKSILGKR